MKLKIEIDESLTETEVLIRCPQAGEELLRLQRRIMDTSGTAAHLVLYKDGGEFYMPAEQLLFFETESEQVYAHTTRDIYRVKRRLYELETELPRVFIRVSKSAIVNTARIYSITRDLPGLSSNGQVHFSDSHKTVYVSRRYASALRDSMNALHLTSRG